MRHGSRRDADPPNEFERLLESGIVPVCKPAPENGINLDAGTKISLYAKEPRTTESDAQYVLRLQSRDREIPHPRETERGLLRIDQ